MIERRKSRNATIKPSIRRITTVKRSTLNENPTESYKATKKNPKKEESNHETGRYRT